MIKLLSIAYNTFLQSLRQPIYVILILAAFAVIMLALTTSTWTMGESGGDFHETDQKMLENSGIGVLGALGLFLAAFTASSALGREIEDRTALTVISKPVARATFVLGKFLGVAMSIALAYYLATIAFLMAVRHHVMPAAYDPYDWPVIIIGLSSLVAAILIAGAGNFLFGWTFTSSLVWCLTVLMTAGMAAITVIGKNWKFPEFAEGIRPELVIGVVLMFEAVLILVAAAVAASTRLGMVATLLVCVGTAAIGLFHPALFDPDVLILRAAGWLTPDLTYFTVQDTLASRLDTGIPTAQVGLATLYMLLYVAALLALGIALFQTRELQQTRASSSVPGTVGLLTWFGRATAVLSVLAGLWMLSDSRSYHTVGYTLIAGFLVLGVALWLLWGYFAHGTRWSYWLILVAMVGALGVSLAAALAPDAVGQAVGIRVNPVRQAVHAVTACGVLILLVLPKTRRHFHQPVVQAT